MISASRAAAENMKLIDPAEFAQGGLVVGLQELQQLAVGGVEIGDTRNRRLRRAAGSMLGAHAQPPRRIMVGLQPKNGVDLNRLAPRMSSALGELNGVAVEAVKLPAGAVR